MDLPANVEKAIISGPIPVLRDWRALPMDQLSRAERIMAFAENYLRVPEGSNVGDPLHLEPFQEAFLYSVFDNTVPTRIAILSIARKNSKTVLCAIILLAYIIGPEALANSSIASGALSREQAALVFKHMVKFINLNPMLASITKITPSGRKIVGLTRNVEYQALARDGSRAVGRSDRVVLGDEWGQIMAEEDDFVSALLSGQGAFDDALAIIISTQAPTDTAYLSRLIDDAARSEQPTIVCHLYAATPNCDLDNKDEWYQANPALGIFRSLRDVELSISTAQRIPSQEARTRNLVLNQRVALENLFVPPTPWKQCAVPPELELFQRSQLVSVGIDLSYRHDLTAVVLACQDEEKDMHIMPFVFVPASNMEAREEKDKLPYKTWIKQGMIIPIGGSSVDYSQVAEYMQMTLMDLGIRAATISFDRWRINYFKDECAKFNLWQECEWRPVGQGFKDMSPLLEAFMTRILDRKLRHGGHPLLNYAVSSAIAVQDPAGNQKLDKSKSTSRIDPLVAAVMASGALDLNPVSEFDVASLIG